MKKTFTFSMMLFVISILFATFQGCEKDDKGVKSGGESGGSDTSSQTIEMIAVEGGTFMMGAQAEDPSGENYDEYAFDQESPVHEVTISDFYIGKYEVTQAQWVAIMGSNPSTLKGDNLPVENVSWNDVMIFIDKLNTKTGKHYRLPTEAEWEFAARGGNESRGTIYSGSNNIDNVGWYKENSGGKTHPVGQKNANELGLYDMSGNVWEWCSDWFYTYDSNSQTDPIGPSSGGSRVIRDAPCNMDARYCRVSYRTGRTPDSRISNIGFRLVLVQ